MESITKTDSMKELIKDDKMEVYVVIGGLSEDQLYIKLKDEIVRITRGSGEYENDFGEFMLRTGLPKDQLIAAKKVMKTLAIPESVKSMEYVGMIKFKLKQVYMDKLTELDELEFSKLLEKLKPAEKLEYKILNKTEIKDKF